MLKSLLIKNIVIMEEARADFSPGFNVITGETGSGKSVLLDSLALLLGEKAESGLVRSGQSQGMFSGGGGLEGNEKAQQFLESRGIPLEDDLVLRRVINADGKSRAYVNDAPATINLLRELGLLLAEMHGQHEQQTISSPPAQMDALDEYAGTLPEKQAVAKASKEWKEAREKLIATIAQIKAMEREQEYLTFARDELTKLDAKPDEENEILNRKISLQSRRKLLDAASKALREIQGGAKVYSALASAQKILLRLGAEEFGSVIQTLERAIQETGEVESALSSFIDEGADESYFEQLDEHLHSLRAAARKYGVPAGELHNLLADMDEKLKFAEQSTEVLSAQQAAEAEAADRYKKAAANLSAKRAREAAKLEKLIMKELSFLKMERALFKIQLTLRREENWGESGMDDINFQAATIPGAPLQDISRIASGGELSRLMLALKSALAGIASAPVMIFDEIDSGLSGAVADSIGARLETLSTQRQIIAVTHQPQVAAKGHNHLRVAKAQQGGGFVSHITKLNAQERGNEIAQMLSGSTVTREAKAAAARLLEPQA